MAFLNTTTFPSPTPQEVSQAELGYIDGLTSNAQAQLDGKLALPGGTTSQILLGTGAPASAVPAAALLAANIPSVLGPTTFSGGLTMANGQTISSASGELNVSSASGGFVARVGAAVVGYFLTTSTMLAPIIRAYTPTNAGLTVYGNTSATDGAYLTLSTSTGNYPGATLSFSQLGTRAASAAVALCPIATGDSAFVTLLTNSTGTSMRCSVEVDGAGTVTITGAAMYVNSGGPAAGEIGIYLTGGILYAKPGSSLTNCKIASFAKIGKA